MNRLLANALGYQVAWFAAVLGAAAGSAWPGVAAAVLFVVLQPAGPRGRRADALLAGGALLAGLLLDGGLSASGWLQYAAPTPGLPAPLWILAIWIGFAATLERSLRFLQGKLLLAAVLGAVGGPLAYFGAARLGAVELVEPTAALTTLAIGWTLVMPALVWLSTRRLLPATVAGAAR